MRRLLPLAALLLAACSVKMRATTDRVSFTDLPQAPVKEMKCRSRLRVCHMNEVTTGFGESVNKIRHNSLANVFSAAIRQAVPRKGVCELGVRFPNTWNDHIEAYGSDNRFLALFEVGNASWATQALCLATKAGGLLVDRVPEFPLELPTVDEDAVAAAKPAAAPAALTKEDIAAAVAAAMKQQQSSAPAEAPAPAAVAAGPRLPPVSKPVIFAADRPDDLAVVVGVESYSDIATKAPYAERDAEAFKAHVRALGVPERNIMLLTGAKASRSALVKNVEGWLPRMAKPGSRVYFYFSGHGAPDPRNGTSYLVPWDGDPNFLDATGYPVNELYKRLGELPASQVLVALDSCFSGAGGRSVLPTGARPLVSRLAPVAVPAKLTVLTASASNEISGSLDDKGHGAFTWFLLEGLNAGKRSAKELHAYLTPKVQDESRRLNRDQTPQLLGADAAFR
jgi:hypothetical protein